MTTLCLMVWSLTTRSKLSAQLALHCSVTLVFFTSVPLAGAISVIAQTGVAVAVLVGVADAVRVSVAVAVLVGVALGRGVGVRYALRSLLECAFGSAPWTLPRTPQYHSELPLRSDCTSLILTTDRSRRTYCVITGIQRAAAAPSAIVNVVPPLL